MDDLKVEHLPLNVIPVTEYDPFEAKFAASLYWLVFCATEDGEFENIPSQVTSPIQRDSEKRITVRPEVIEFLTNGEIYCKVCDSIFHGKVPVVGQWAIIQTLSRHGFYVVEEGDIAVTDSALQQRKPFRKSTHLALMDCLMSAFSAQAVSVQQVVQSVSKFSSFNASKELPFDLEDALLLWINKICAALNDNQLKKQRQHAEQLLQNQDKAKRFRFRRDQLQPKVQTEFPVMEDLLKDISDGQSLLGIVMFYHPTVISLEDIRFDKNLSTEDCVHNLDLFRSLCSQFICTSVLALKLEDLLYGSQAMKPNVIALLAEIFNKCEVESTSPENGVKEQPASKSDVDLRYIVANKENVMDNSSSSTPVLNSDKNKGIEHESSRETYNGKNERFSYISGQLRSSSSDRIEQINSSVWKSQSDTQVNSNSRLSFKSPFQLDFTVDDDIQQPLNGPLSTQDVHEKEKENPFSVIFQRPVLAGDRKRSTPNVPGAGGSPRATPRQEHSLLMRRNKQKQRTLDLEEWDMQQEELEDLQLNDIQRSQSLTGLDKAKVEPRQSFHAWREDTGASLSDTNLASSRNEKISLDFRPKLPTSAPQRGTEGSIPQRGAEGIHVVPSGLKAKREEHSSHDSLSSTDSLNMAPSGDKLRDSLLLGVRDSCMSDISTKELNQFEEIEAQILAGKSVETPRTFVKPRNKLSKAPLPQEDEDELNTSVNSEDMDMFRLEVLQRLTEDKLRQIPDGDEMEDDDPILLARSNAASGSNPSDERARLEVPDAPADDPTDQLSPITETSEPVVSNPNSVSSANSTAPSSPCSPLDVAPFMPEFFTTSPANSLDRKSKRFSVKTREDSDATLVGEEDDEFPSEPVTSVTPRFQTKSGDKNGLFPVKSKSFEQLARGSYTVGHVSEDSAKAAGIPVIGTDGPVTEPGFPVESGDPVTEAGTPVFSTEARGRTDSVTSTSAHQELSKVSQNSRDLSGFRPLILSSDGVELIGVANEGVDGRRDSLETSPPHSPAFTLGMRVDARQEAVLQSRGMTTQDSPSDVVIFERSLSNPPEGRTPLDASCSETRENGQCNPGTVTRSSKSEAYVFDFNQDTVEHYKNGHKTQDFRTYKKSQLDGQAQSEVPQGDQLAASVNEDTAEQRFQGAQKDARFGTYSKNSHSDEREQSAADSLDGRHRHRISEEARGSVVSVKDLRQSDGFSTFRKDSTSELKNGAVESSAHALDLRRSDGFTTFRKQVKQVSDAALEKQRFSTASTHDQRSSEADRFSTFAKSAKKQSDGQNYAAEGLHHFQETTSSGRADLQQATVTARPPSSVGGESERQTSPRGGDEEQIRPSGSPNLTRSRTFRKTPDGQIIDDRSSVGNNEENSSASRDNRLPGRNVVASNRVSSPGAGITLMDDTEAWVRLTRQVDASADRTTVQERSPTNSPRRRSSPRQTGRGSPVETITWVDSAKSLTDRGKQPRYMCGKRDTCADRTTAQERSPTNSPRRRSSPRQTGRGSPVETITWGDSAKSLGLNNRGEIDALQQDDADDDPVLAEKLANLRVQLAEKRRQIEAMKSRCTAEQEDQHCKMMDTLYGHVINKARGGQTVGEGPGSEVLDSRKPLTDQPTPPIAWSSPANSPLPASASHPSSNGQQFETREFRLSEYPPCNDLATKQDITRPTSQPVGELSSRPTPVPPRPSSHDPAGSRHTAPMRKCWDVDLGQIATPPPLMRHDTASVNMDTKQEIVSPEGGDAAEIEVENLSPLKKGLAMFIGDDESQGLTPEQEKKREKFMRLRLKKQEEDRTRKEAELEKKRKRDEKQHEKVVLQKMEEQRLRREEVEQRRAEQELRIRKTEAARVPDSYATYRRQVHRQQVYDVGNDVNSHFVPSPVQSSGFAEFSGPQCYVKPSGKSNRKIIVNAISHVCLSGTVNQDQKEKCLQAISESDGHHFMILFKDGLKFRGIYVHNLDNDQLYKVYGIGPRVVTSKMFEFIYKYNSGAKEFTKIPSKTISISVDGFAIQKSCWSTGKPVVPSKTASNFKKPPRPPQR